jgi:tetratricopeptide (TPR) repeat protein
MHRLVQQVRQAQVPVRAHAPRARWVLPRLGDWFEARRMDFDALPAFEAEVDHLEAWARHAASLEVPREQVRLGWLGAYPHYHRGRFADALSVVRSVQHLLAAIKDAEPRLALCVYHDETTLLTQLARPEEALRIVDRALAFGEAALGTEHREVILLLGAKSIALGEIGNMTAAIDCARDMLLRSQRARDDVGDLIGLAHNKVGIAYARAGRNREACTHAERSLELCMARYGERHPDTAIAMGNLGIGLARVDRFEEGLDLIRKSLALVQEVLGEEHPWVAAAYGNLAEGLLHAGQRSAAADALREEWSLGRRVLPAGHSDTLMAARNLARTLHSMHRTDEARAVIEQTLAELPGDHPERPRLEALRQAPRPTAEPTRPSGKTSKAARKAQAAARKRNRPQKKRR